MVKNRVNASTPGKFQELSMSLLAMGIYGILVGETILMALSFWPGTLENDLAAYPLLFSLFFIIVASLLLLISLLILKVHVLLVIGAFLLALLASFVQGKIFPTDASLWTTFWFLTYGSVTALMSLIILILKRDIWPILWPTLLVAGVCAAIPITFLILQGPVEWLGPKWGRDIIIMSLLVGGIIPIAVYWFTKTRREHTFQG